MGFCSSPLDGRRLVGVLFSRFLTLSQPLPSREGSFEIVSYYGEG